METARLILEFLKVLVWPIVTIAGVLIFKPHLERIFRQFSDRLGTAETLKLGVLGQEVQISGTAKELAKERARLAQSSGAPDSENKLQAIDQAARELNNPVADVVGLELVHTKGGLRLENLVRAVLGAFAASTGGKPPSENPPMVIS